MPCPDSILAPFGKGGGAPILGVGGVIPPLKKPWDEVGVALNAASASAVAARVTASGEPGVSARLNSASLDDGLEKSSLDRGRSGERDPDPSRGGGGGGEPTGVITLDAA